jgi:hypothetical protein
MCAGSRRWALGGRAWLVLLIYLGWQLVLAQLERRGRPARRAGARTGADRARRDRALSATLHSVALALADKDSENRQLLERLESVMAAALGLAFLDDRLSLVNAEMARLGYSRGRWRPARRCWPMPASRSGAGRHPGPRCQAGHRRAPLPAPAGQHLLGPAARQRGAAGEPEAGMV